MTCDVFLADFEIHSQKTDEMSEMSFKRPQSPLKALKY